MVYGPWLPRHVANVELVVQRRILVLQAILPQQIHKPRLGVRHSWHDPVVPFNNEMINVF